MKKQEVMRRLRYDKLLKLNSDSLFRWRFKRRFSRRILGTYRHKIEVRTGSPPVRLEYMPCISIDFASYVPRSSECPIAALCHGIRLLDLPYGRVRQRLLDCASRPMNGRCAATAVGTCSRCFIGYPAPQAEPTGSLCKATACPAPCSLGMTMSKKSVWLGQPSVSPSLS